MPIERQLNGKSSKFMAKLGDYEFPEIGLAESIELTRRIYDELGGEVRRDGLAMVLGMSPAGGAFGARVGALRIWGLVTGRGMIELSAAGVRVSSPPSSSEELQVMRRLAASVPLFNELHKRIGDSGVDQSVLAAMLREITGVGMDEVVRRVAVIDRIFEGIREYLGTSPDDGAEQNAIARSGIDGGCLPKGWMEFRYEDGALRMRETAANLDMLIATLEARRDRLSD